MNTDKSNKLAIRLDGLSQSEMGMGGMRDKLDKITPYSSGLSFSDSQNWYLSNGYIQNIVDIPAEDATREWIEIKTNRDDLGISRLIQNRFVELDFQRKLKELIRYSRMYSLGGFLYYGIDSSIPQTDIILEQAMPESINRIDYINVFGPDMVSLLPNGVVNPLGVNFHRPELSINSVKVHPSRYHWLILSYLTEKNTGVSVIQTVLDAVKAQGIALWSISSILSELSIKVFKSPSVNTEDPAKLFELISLIRQAISTQGVFAAGEGESLERLNGVIPGIKESLDFILENMSGLSKIPKSRLSGQSQGTLTGGQYDLVSYYDSIAKFQEIELRPIIERCISLIVRETSGKVYSALGGNVNGLDWEFEFENLWKLSEMESSDVNLKKAQADKIYVETGVLAPAEVRKNRFDDLEEFGDVKSEDLDFASPDSQIDPNADNSNDASTKSKDAINRVSTANA
jgi:phage-related protein (TIGR01555 family)